MLAPDLSPQAPGGGALRTALTPCAGARGAAIGDHLAGMLASLLAEVIANPRAIAPRLVYADASVSRVLRKRVLTGDER